MVARGDLGVEIPAEEVPVVQGRLLKCLSSRRANGDRGDRDVGINDL